MMQVSAELIRHGLASDRSGLAFARLGRRSIIF